MATLTLTASGDRSNRNSSGGSREETRKNNRTSSSSGNRNNVSNSALASAAAGAAALEEALGNLRNQANQYKNQANSYRDQYNEVKKKYDDVEDRYYYDIEGNRLSDDDAYYNQMYQQDPDKYYNEFMDPENTSAGRAYREMMDALEAQIAAAEAKYQAQIDSAVRELEYQKEGINDQFGTGAQQAYINKMLAQRDLPQQLASTGIQGGLTESSLLSLENEYSNNYNDLLKERNRSNNEVDLNIANVRANGAAAMAEAAANYQAQMAQLAYQQQMQAQQMRQQWAMQQAQLDQQRELAMLEMFGQTGTTPGSRSQAASSYYGNTSNPYAAEEEPVRSSSGSTWTQPITAGASALQEALNNRRTSRQTGLQQAVANGYNPFEQTPWW